jgi:hypothetical protein
MRARFVAVLVAAFVAALVLGLGATPSDAQPRRGRDTTVERREQIKKRIRAMRAYSLTEELALDEATAARLFPLLARYDDEIDKLLEKRVDVQRRLRRADGPRDPRADGSRDPRALDRVIDEALANQRALWDLEDRRISELRKILAPPQTAKLLVVLPALERKIQNQLLRAIGKGRPGDAPDGLDDDDDKLPDEAPVRPRQRLRRDAPSNAPGAPPPCDPSSGPCR